MTDINHTISVCQMPEAIAKAINEVMSGVKKLAKDENNQFAKYKFASIDSFLDEVRPLCASTGLAIIVDENEFEVVTTGQEKAQKSWLKLQYHFYLMHSSGAVWQHPLKKHIMVDAAMGAQAFGAAQSYALKQFMRALFQISTGEEDADSYEQSNLPKVKQQAEPGAAHITKNNGRYEGLTGPHKTMTALQSALRKLVHDIEGCSDSDQLEALLGQERGTIEQCKVDKPTWYDDPEHGLKQRIEKARKAFESDFPGDL